MISPQRRAEIIDALRRGTVPQHSLDAFAVGLERFEPAIGEELDRVKGGGSGFKAVRGEYGSGKTFFARWLQEHAKKLGFITAEVQISETETPLHRLETVYRRLMERLATSDVASGALRSIIDLWFYTLESDVLAEGRVEESDEAGLLKRTNELMEQRLVNVSRQAPMFAAALRGYREALAQDDEATAEAILAWVAGQPNVAAAARRAAGIKGEVDHFGALSFLQGLLTVVRDSGQAGLVLVLDEVETLQRVRSDVRDKGLNALRQLMDEIDSGRFPGLYLVLTGTPAFFDGPQGVHRLPPLAQRLSVDFGTDAKFDNPRAAQIRLPGFDLVRLVEVGRKVRDLYAAASSCTDRITSHADDAYLERLAQAVTGNLGGKIGVAPRIFLKKLVGDVLDRIDQFEDFDPRRDYELTIRDVELTTTERSALGERPRRDRAGPLSAFDQLHPAMQHHVVNTLGWPSLRPLQEASIEPLLRGEGAILLAPTAGGKTEAAIFPVLSRMLSEGWTGLSVIYVCPIKALLNNLYERLEHYSKLVGRSVALWHGDVGQGARKAIRREPPDILLTTPESLEANLVSRVHPAADLFRHARTVIVDEIHAFAGDDRGWHLLGVLSRIEVLAGRELQRIGLSATVGNPEELLGWLHGGRAFDGAVINPPAEATAEPEVRIDYVGSLLNAATVISRLHRGEKRLVFCDSRSRVEDLAQMVRELGVRTFVSHSSLSASERRDAEEAFATADDCVIVATSTLELGIDVGDLDRVIQIDAPGSVASFLQRIGRTGRRKGTSRNCLFLATSQDALLRAAALVQLWEQGFVEPVTPPSFPAHIVAQQMMAIALQEAGLTRDAWRKWLAGVGELHAIAERHADEIIDHMLAHDLLFEDEGMLWFGARGEEEFGRRHFMELLSVFTSEPLFTVLHGRAELGHVHRLSFVKARREEPTVLSLAGRAWVVTSIDWGRRVAQVRPSEQPGRSRWLGGAQPISFEVCQSLAALLLQREHPTSLTTRAKDALSEARTEFGFLRPGMTALAREPGGDCRWWTFAGLLANRQLAAWLERTLPPAAARAENLCVVVSDLADTTSVEEARRSVATTDSLSFATHGMDELTNHLKFSECVPMDLLRALLAQRYAAPAHVRRALRLEVFGCTAAQV